MSLLEKFKGLIILLVFGVVIPVIVMCLASSEFYDRFIVNLANKVFLGKYGQQYRGYFTYLLDATLTPFMLVLAYSISWTIIPFIIPGSLFKTASKKLVIIIYLIVFFLAFITFFAIPITHYPAIIKDYNCVKHGITKQVQTDQYNTYMRMEHGSKFYTRYPVYYIHFEEQKGNKTINKTFPIGSDLYHYLKNRPKENIIVNFMPNTGIFLNIQIGHEKFGAYSEEPQ